MANEWKYLRGAATRVTFPNGTDALAKGTPCNVTAGVLAVCTAGSTVEVVTDEAASASASKVVCLIPNGAVFEVAVSGNLAPGAQAYIATNNKLGAGVSGQLSNASIVDYDPANDGIAHAIVFSNLVAPVTHA